DHERAIGAEHAPRELERIGLVVDDEHTYAMQVERALLANAVTAVPVLLAWRDARQYDMKRRAATFTGARRRHAASVQLDDLLGDCEPEAQAGIFAAARGIVLAERIEHERQPLGRESDARVLDEHLPVPVDARERRRDRTAARRELDGVAQHIPHHLLEPVRVAEDEARSLWQRLAEPYALRLGGARELLERRLDDLPDVGLLRVEADLPAHHAG